MCKQYNIGGILFCQDMSHYLFSIIVHCLLQNNINYENAMGMIKLNFQIELFSMRIYYWAMITIEWCRSDCNELDKWMWFEVHMRWAFQIKNPLYCKPSAKRHSLIFRSFECRIEKGRFIAKLFPGHFPLLCSVFLYSIVVGAKNIHLAVYSQPLPQLPQKPTSAWGVIK